MIPSLLACSMIVITIVFLGIFCILQFQKIQSFCCIFQNIKGIKADASSTIQKTIDFESEDLILVSKQKYRINHLERFNHEEEGSGNSGLILSSSTTTVKPETNSANSLNVAFHFVSNIGMTILN